MTNEEFLAIAISHLSPDKPPMLLGDRIAMTLEAFGITKEKWGEFVNEKGLPPGCGGCDQRQEALNNADDYARKIAAEFGNAAMDAISKFWAPVSWLRKPKSPPDQSGTSPAP